MPPCLSTKSHVFMSHDDIKGRRLVRNAGPHHVGHLQKQKRKMDDAGQQDDSEQDGRCSKTLMDTAAVTMHIGWLALPFIFGRFNAICGS